MSGFEVGPILKGFKTAYDFLEKRKQSKVLELLHEGKVPLEEAIKSNDFVQAFVTLSETLKQTGVDQKVEMLAKLFMANYNDDKFNDLSAYEERLNILSELSVKEIKALHLLDNFKFKSFTHIGGIDVPRDWSCFWSFLSKELALPLDEVSGFLTRLSRSGLYEPKSAGDWDGTTWGALTPSYYQLKSYINLMIENGDIKP